LRDYRINVFFFCLISYVYWPCVCRFRSISSRTCKRQRSTRRRLSDDQTWHTAGPRRLRVARRARDRRHRHQRSARVAIVVVAPYFPSLVFFVFTPPHRLPALHVSAIILGGKTPFYYRHACRTHRPPGGAVDVYGYVGLVYCVLRKRIIRRDDFRFRPCIVADLRTNVTISWLYQTTVYKY